MEAPRRPRLRLSRRRLPSGGGPPRPRPRSPQDSDGAGERARLWAELLRTVSADLGVDGELPPLPAFPAEEPRLDPARAAPPEVFTVGSETFSWTPFPPAPRGAEGPGCSYRVLRGAGGRPGSPAPSLPGCPPPEPREAPPVPERPAGGGAQTLQSCPMCQADFAPGGLCRCWRPSRTGELSASFLRYLRGQIGARLGFQQLSRLAQLDIDSHLAQCLADSTEDVEW